MGTSQVTTCKGRSEDVLKNIGYWLASDVDEVVVVDYACPENIGKKLKESEYARNPKLSIVSVPPEVAGPFFNLSAARNTGAQIARNEYFMFLDSDCRATPLFMEKVRRTMGDNERGRTEHDLLVSGHHCLSEDTVKQLPLTWTLDGQCLIRSSTFYNVNGYTETEERAGWGAESYDLYLRAAQLKDTSIGFFDIGQVIHTPHKDAFRHQYQSYGFATKVYGARENAYSKRNRMFARGRLRTYRAQPGRLFGVPEGQAARVRIFRECRERVFCPGED